MVVYCVSVFLKEGREEDFREATRLNHEGTRTEPGNLRFDVLQNPEEPSKWMLYEVYRTPEDVKRHKETAHYLAWREKVSPWMARPREGVQMTPWYPAEEGSW